VAGRPVHVLPQIDAGSRASRGRPICTPTTLAWPSVFDNTAAARGQRSGARTRLRHSGAASQRRRQAHGVDLEGRPGPIGARRQVRDEAGSRRGLGRRGPGRDTGDCPNVRAGRCRARGRAHQLDSGARGGVDGAAPGRDVDRRREDCKRGVFRAGGGRTRQGWGVCCRRQSVRACSKTALHARAVVHNKQAGISAFAGRPKAVYFGGAFRAPDSAPPGGWRAPPRSRGPTQHSALGCSLVSVEEMDADTCCSPPDPASRRRRAGAPGVLSVTVRETLQRVGALPVGGGLRSPLGPITTNADIPALLVFWPSSHVMVHWALDVDGGVGTRERVAERAALSSRASGV
jgi:hypothetical protein